MKKNLIWLAPVVLAILVVVVLLVAKAMGGGDSQPHVYNPF